MVTEACFRVHERPAVSSSECRPAVTGDGSTSRIVRSIKPPNRVTLPYYAADLIVTEHGFAEVRGLPLELRAEAIRALAHPDQPGYSYSSPRFVHRTVSGWGRRSIPGQHEEGCGGRANRSRATPPSTSLGVGLEARPRRSSRRPGAFSGVGAGECGSSGDQPSDKRRCARVHVHAGGYKPPSSMECTVAARAPDREGARAVQAELGVVGGLVAAARQFTPRSPEPLYSASAASGSSKSSVRNGVRTGRYRRKQDETRSTVSPRWA